MINKRLVILFIGHFLAIQGFDREGSDYEYYPEVNGWLKLHRAPTDWMEARITCHIEEALLAADWNPEMRSAVNKLQVSKDLAHQAVYAGAEVSLTLTDVGEYIYLDGEPILSILVDGIKRLDNCTVFIANGTMEEVDCKQKLPFVCFAPAPACGKEDLGYKFSNETRHCYKFHSENTTWMDAYRTCTNEGAYLAIVNSEEEATVIRNQCKDTSRLVAVGFYYWKLSNSWRTIAGQTIEEAGFAKWHEGEPTLTSYPTATSGFLHSDGSYFSYYKTYNYPFVCEKNPNIYNTEVY